MKLKNEKGLSIIQILLFIAIIVMVFLLISSTAGLFEQNETNNVVDEENYVVQENNE